MFLHILALKVEYFFIENIIIICHKEWFLQKFSLFNKYSKKYIYWEINALKSVIFTCFILKMGYCNLIRRSLTFKSDKTLNSLNKYYVKKINIHIFAGLIE